MLLCLLAKPTVGSWLAVVAVVAPVAAVPAAAFGGASGHAADNGVSFFF